MTSFSGIQTKICSGEGPGAEIRVMFIPEYVVSRVSLNRIFGEI